MLERYGIVTRETVLAEGVPGGFSTLYAELGNLELLGTARRGYFVEGLGGAQFALPGAVERLRSLPEADGSYLLLAATDPANPYGASLPWPKREGGRRPAPRPRRPRPAARRRAGRLRRARRPRHPAPRRARAATSWRRRCGALADAVARRPAAEAGDRETRRRAGDRLRPRGGADRRRLQPRPPQTDPRGPLRAASTSATAAEADEDADPVCHRFDGVRARRSRAFCRSRALRYGPRTISGIAKLIRSRPPSGRLKSHVQIVAPVGGRQAGRRSVARPPSYSSG